MKKTIFAAMLATLLVTACSGPDNSNVPAGTNGGTGAGQAPTTTSADSSNGYADSTHQYKNSQP